jgi:predicted outer membrane repeat protein
MRVLYSCAAFLRNKAGHTRHDLEPYKESIQMQGDDVRIQSPCCKGIISLVGKGGAVRVQTGHVTFDSCTFINNSARLLGGAIFVDRGPNIPDRSVKENLNKVVLLLYI